MKLKLFLYDDKHGNMVKEVYLGELTDTERNVADKIIQGMEEANFLDGRYRAATIAESYERKLDEDSGESYLEFS